MNKYSVGALFKLQDKTRYMISCGVRYFPKGIFPRANFFMTISQVATTQVFNFPSGNFPKDRLGPLRRRRLQWGSIAAAKMG